MPVHERTYTRSARLLGLANTVISIACAAFLAVSLSFFARGRVDEGLWLLLGVLGARWAMLTSTLEWSHHAGAALRARWRATLVGHFVRPQPEGERGRGDLSLAIERASDQPMLDLLETSAVTSIAGLVVLFWAGGWLATLITVALLVAAVPLYRRAGRRSEATASEYQRRRALLESRQLELLHHTTELRALGAVDYGANEIAAISDSEHAIAIRAIRVALESSLVTEFLSGVSIGLVAMVVGFALLGGRVSLEHALIAVLVTSEIFTHVRRFGVEFHRREDAERSLNLLDDRRDDPERRDDVTDRRHRPRDRGERTRLRRRAGPRSVTPRHGTVRLGQDDAARHAARLARSDRGHRRAHARADRARERRERVVVRNVARQPHARRRDRATTTFALGSRRSDSPVPDSTTSTRRCWPTVEG